MRFWQTKFESAPAVPIPIFANTKLSRREFPLLARAASWTGGIANQNRGTIGGNIVNASPAADSLPALLVYEAELILVSVRGERRVPYLTFHTGYKTTKLAGDELVRAVCLPRRFSGFLHHARKVGARNAQAIAKVCIAALGRIADGVVEDVRIALGSVAPVPLRLIETERVVRGKLSIRLVLPWRERQRPQRFGRLTISDRRRGIVQRWRTIWWRNFFCGWARVQESEYRAGAIGIACRSRRP